VIDSLDRSKAEMNFHAIWFNMLSMTMEEFRHSLRGEQPPAHISLSLAGLWWDAKGDWNRAHESAQQDEGLAGSWVHAYLHRKEGDSSNAGYWYRRAEKAPARCSLEQEWLEITESLLIQAGSDAKNRAPRARG